MAGRDGEAVLYAVGDIAPDRSDPRECFDKVRARLAEADLLFCQLETNLTTRGERAPQARHAVRGSPAIAPALRAAGFGVVSVAGNHCLDWGQAGFFDTLENLKAAGLSVVGGGADIAEARRPALVEANGVKVAVLAYSSILPMNHWAEANRPGCAPMRAHTHYEQIEHDQPGTPPRIHTFAHRGDLEAMCADIRAARDAADVVLVSHHWGIHFVPAVLADYQREVAYAAIEAGADAILGHHAHILKGVEVYRGRPILYSLCNFAVDLRMDEAHANSKAFREIQALSPDWIPDFDSLYNFPPDSRMTVVAKLKLSRSGVDGLSLLPAWIGPDSQPEVLAAGDPRFGKVAAYIERISRDAGLSTRFVQEGDELVVEP